jgi:hypothetical protein
MRRCPSTDSQSWARDGARIGQYRHCGTARSGVAIDRRVQLPAELAPLHSQESEGGRVRHLANPDGQTIVERLEAFDNAARSYSYSIHQAPFPVTGYRAVRPSNGWRQGSRVRCSGQFTPKRVSDQEASRLFQSIYEDGLKALAAGFASKRNK